MARSIYNGVILPSPAVAAINLKDRGALRSSQIKAAFKTAPLKTVAEKVILTIDNRPTQLQKTVESELALSDRIINSAAAPHGWRDSALTSDLFVKLNPF